MASITMTAASFSAGTCAAVSQRASANRRGVVVAKLAKPTEQAPKIESSSSSSSAAADKSRRNVMFAAAAAAICSVAYGNQASIAAETPKAGTPEAKKFYAPICVTMPTASVCHK